MFLKQVVESRLEASEMARWVKVLSSKTDDDLCSMPGGHCGRKEETRPTNCPLISTYGLRGLFMAVNLNTSGLK